MTENTKNLWRTSYRQRRRAHDTSETMHAYAECESLLRRAQKVASDARLSRDQVQYRDMHAQSCDVKYMTNHLDLGWRFLDISGTDWAVLLGEQLLGFELAQILVGDDWWKPAQLLGE